MFGVEIINLAKSATSKKQQETARMTPDSSMLFASLLATLLE
jgi:hypothetical protein